MVGPPAGIWEPMGALILQPVDDSVVPLGQPPSVLVYGHVGLGSLRPPVLPPTLKGSAVGHGTIGLPLLLAA